MEEQSLQISQMAVSGGPKRTATEASLIASYGQLNREWMQQAVADSYSWIVKSAFRMMADEAPVLRPVLRAKRRMRG